MSVAKLGTVIPFADLLGIELLEARDGHSRLALEIRPELTNSWHMAHGGVVMTLLDIALAVATRSLQPAVGGAMTVEMKVNFISPGYGKLIAEGRAVGGGRSLFVSEGEIRDASGALVAKAIGTFKLRRKVEAGPGDG